MNKDLNQLRRKIDALDNKLIFMLAKRTKIVEIVGKYKIQHGLKPLDRKRWQEVLNSKIALGNKVGLSSTLVRSIFDIIHKHSLLIQKKIKL